MDYVLGAEIKKLIVRTYAGSRWRTTFSIEEAFPAAPSIQFPVEDEVWLAELDVDDANVAAWDITPEQVDLIPDGAVCELWIEDEVWAAGEVVRRGDSA